MEKPQLTPQERRCFEVVCELLNEGTVPTFAKVAAGMGITRSGAQRHMVELRAKGYLRGPRTVGEWALTRRGKSEQEKTHANA